jgi:succinate dehydrogenase / fumarate reductase membrane anchor subunit
MVKPVNRIITGAHYGLKDWLIQRITAVLMIIYTILLLVLVAVYQPENHEDFKSLFSIQWVKIASLLCFVSLCWHAWVGVRNVLMDYVHPMPIRLTLQMTCIVVLLGYLIWFLDILWG